MLACLFVILIMVRQSIIVKGLSAYPSWVACYLCVAFANWHVYALRFRAIVSCLQLLVATCHTFLVYFAVVMKRRRDDTEFSEGSDLSCLFVSGSILVLLCI